ncbi:MAG TPA: MBL fold metallo-hydrolase [Rhizomicrobium sp.]|jgi:phosphoribosyl 1,2-cyclic phosphate phosphodiesterase|nr:MBL fold metallo-hydrolase [Rhizomicrobium sp.]
MTGTLTVTILGCGSSGGVPRLGGPDGSGSWGACDPDNPKNRRRRCSMLVAQQLSQGVTTVLVDTAPDLRQQLLDARVSSLDGVIITHDHADQLHGIDDLRLVFHIMRRCVDVYADEETMREVRRRFGYCFETPDGGVYPPILNPHVIPEPFRAFAIAGAGGAIPVLPFWQQHGPIRSLGLRFGPIAYSSDVNGLPEDSFAALEGVDCWILDALRYTPHPTHANVETALAWIARVKPKRAILTNLHLDLDYETLRRELPKGVEPAYDGMVITPGDAT